MTVCGRRSWPSFDRKRAYRGSRFAIAAILRLLLAGGSGLGLGGLLAVASNHDHAEERADDGGTEEDENDGDADGPDAREEEVLERVVIVDKGLREKKRISLITGAGIFPTKMRPGATMAKWKAEEDEECAAYHQERPNGIVQEDNGGGHEHGEADESVKLVQS